MAIKYDNKSPGKLWYMWQNTKALVRTPFQSTTKKDAQRFGKDAGITIGSLVGANLLLSVPVIMAAPILPWIVGAGAITVAFKFGRDAWNKFKGLKETSFVSGYVREQENKWYDRKKNGNAFSRALKSVKEKIAKIPTALKTAAKWLGLGTAVAGAGALTAGLLGHFGVVPALAPATAAVVNVGVAAGLTAGVAFGVAVGVVALAVPVGLGVFAAARNALAGTKETKPTFFKRPAPDAAPIDQGVVFDAQPKSFDFNDNAPKKDTPKDSGMSEERKKAAEARRKNKSGRDNSGRF